MEHRKLLPRAEPSSRPGQPSSASLSGLTPKRKKAPGRTACDPCRSRKSACDGQRPICSTCRARRSSCSYTERDRLRSGEASGKIVSLLRSVNYDEAVQVLQRLRENPESDPDYETLLSEPHQSQPNRQSEQNGSNGRTPESSCGPEQCLAVKATGLELELQARYPIAYPPLCPIDVDALLPEALPGSLFTPGSPGKIALDLGETDASGFPGSSIPQTPAHQQPPQSTSGVPARGYCDARLYQVDFRDWTAVPLNDSMAAGAISFYLETEHTTHGLFDADLFIHDLASGERSFCSPLLVNAVLAWSCQSYWAVEAAAADFRLPLFQEARRLWDHEEHRNTLTCVAAAHLMSMTATCQAKDDLSNHFIQEAIDIGRQMGLYGAVEQRSAKTWLDNHHAWIRAASHTAWGGYCAITHRYLQSHEPLIERPPLLPIPGEIGSGLYRSKGDRYESYPMLFAGRTFNKLCELFKIAHKLLYAYYDGNGRDDGAAIKHVDLAFSESLFRELLDWSASLSLDLVRAEGNSHHTVVLHTFFHCLVLDILRPFMDGVDDLHLTSFEAGEGECSLEVVYRASTDQLKRLVLYYLSRFTYAAHSAVWLPALIYVLNSLIRDARLAPKQSQTPEWNLYFRACMRGLCKQLPFYPRTDKIIHGILSMAVRDGVMTGGEAAKTLEDMRRESGTEGQDAVYGDPSPAGSGGEASFIVDLDLATRDAAAATASALVDDFDNLSMLANVASMVVNGQS